MKKLALILSMIGLSIGAFAQGVVNFANSPSTLVSYQYLTDGSGLISGPAGSWYFALLVAPPGTTDPRFFTFTGVYTTNSAIAPGRFVYMGRRCPPVFGHLE